MASVPLPLYVAPFETVTMLPDPAENVVLVRRASAPASETDAAEATSPAESDAVRRSRLPRADELSIGFVPPSVTLPPLTETSGDVDVLESVERRTRMRLKSGVIVLVLASSSGPASVTVAGATTSPHGG